MSDPSSPDSVYQSQRAVVRLAGTSGAILREGTVSILSGTADGEMTALVRHQALSFAMTPPGEDAEGGSVLYATDVGREVALESFRESARCLDGGPGGLAHDALDQIHVLSLHRLDGLSALVNAVASVGPRLVVVDPVLAAYVGDPGEARPVREFLGALSLLARRYHLGILLVLHTAKGARKAAEPLYPGRIDGANHWTSGVRGVLVLRTDPDREGGFVLACLKSNWGTARLALALDIICGESRLPVGIRAADGCSARLGAGPPSSRSARWEESR